MMADMMAAASISLYLYIYKIAVCVINSFHIDFIVDISPALALLMARASINRDQRYRGNEN